MIGGVAVVAGHVLAICFQGHFYFVLAVNASVVVGLFRLLVGSEVEDIFEGGSDQAM